MGSDKPPRGDKGNAFLDKFPAFQSGPGSGRLEYQPLFGKGETDTSERRKSSLRVWTRARYRPQSCRGKTLICMYSKWRLYVPVKSKLQHPPGHTPGIWRLFLTRRAGIWSPLIGVGNLITSLDIMLRVALIPCGLIKHGGDGGDKLWWIQKKRLSISGRLVENQRPTIALFCICRCLRPIYIYI